MNDTSSPLPPRPFEYPVQMPYEYMQRPFEMPPPMAVFEPKETRFLLISDTHLHSPNLNKFSDWIKAMSPDYDMVLILGNSSNMINKFRNDYEAEYEAADQLASIIEFLKDLIGKPIVYIPGNTEPSGSYNSTLEIPNAMNLHKKAMMIDEGLVVIGFGGSIPVKKDEKEILEGFPYKSEEEFGTELTSCIETANKTFGPASSYLLMTHIGPMESGSTEVYLGKDQVNGGSKNFSEILKKNNFIGHIHGHAAGSEGLTKPFGSSIPIINPGGLVNGRFGEMSLRRDITGKWKVGEVNFKTLN